MKEDTSPAKAAEEVFLIAKIAAKEGRDVATTYITCAFMQTELDGKKIKINLRAG